MSDSLKKFVISNENALNQIKAGEPASTFCSMRLNPEGDLVAAKSLLAELVEEFKGFDGTAKSINVPFFLDHIRDIDNVIVFVIQLAAHIRQIDASSVSVSDIPVIALKMATIVDRIRLSDILNTYNNDTLCAASPGCKEYLLSTFKKACKTTSGLAINAIHTERKATEMKREEEVLKMKREEEVLKMKREEDERKAAEKKREEEMLKMKKEEELRTAFQKGLAEGFQKGRAEGIQVGYGEGLLKGRENGLQDGREDRLQKGIEC